MGEGVQVRSLGGLILRAAEKWPDKVSHRYPTKGSNKDQLTFSELKARVFEYARAVDALNIKKGDHVVILGESSIEWILTDWACQSLGIVTIPIYPTLPPDQATHIFDDSRSVRAFVLEERLAPKLPGKPVTVLRGDQSLVSHASDSNLSEAEWVSRIESVDLDDLATIIYSSGTTGAPKGVMLSHRSFVELVDGISQTISVSSSDTFLSFLPLSHVYERFVGHVLPVALGAEIVQTASAATIASDLVNENPTILACVPRLLEAFKGRIVDAAKKQSPMQQRMFELAQSQGLKHARGQFAPLFPVTDRLVGAKIRQKIGPSLRFFASGGAALPLHVSEFFLAFRILVLQGYGLTETCAASSFNPPERNRPWTVGEPIQGVEMKIAADGEILIKGSSVMQGYYNMPEATREAIDSDGWFHTGDIGEFDGPSLKITDRKKDILVLGNGKNVAPQKIENVLKESEWINEAVVFGDGMEYCCALVVPEFDRFKDLLAKQGVTGLNTYEMCERPELKDVIKKEVEKANGLLADFERVKKHSIVKKAFSIEDGELTPSLKVRKKVVKEMYSDQLKAMQRSS